MVDGTRPRASSPRSPEWWLQKGGWVMGQDLNGSVPGRISLWVALIALPIVSLPVQARAGIVELNNATQNRLDPVAQALISHESESPAASQMYLPDPAQSGAVAVGESTIPEITIPQLPSGVSTTSAASKDGASAIPLPPAVQSGITGLAALGLAAGLRRLRRAFR